MRNNIRIRSAMLAGFSFALICLGSCGYQFQGSGTILPEDIRSVYIPLVQNDTPQPGLEQAFTESVRSRFEQYGALKVVDELDQADAIFRVRVTDIDTETRDVTGQSDIELEVELQLVVAAELRRRTGQLLWRNPSFSRSDVFSTVSDTVVTSSAAFAQSGIGAGDLGTLEARELSRGQAREVLENLIEEVSRGLYLEAVADSF